MRKLAYVIFLIYFSFVLSAFFILFFFPFQAYHADEELISAKNDNDTETPISSPIQLPKFTYESIFAKDHSWVDGLPKEKTTTLITTGDVGPARTVNYKMITYNDFTHPFLKTASFLREGDITLINLEGPLIENCPVTNTGMVFCGDQRFVEGLKFAGIDVVNLANNHTLNYGIKGMEQTINVLGENNIKHCGFPINDLAIVPTPITIGVRDPASANSGVGKQLNNRTMGFIGWNLLEQFEEQEVLNAVKKADSEVDVLIVSVHWGAEYQRIPADWQKEMARKMVDNGAELIVGNHPHWYQPVEIYKDRLIIYAQGNFVFDQMWSRETRTGIVGKHVFYENRLVDSQFFPIFIEDFNQPHFLEGEEKEKVMEKLEEISN